MAFSLIDFKANLIGEGARPTLFEARVFFPLLNDFNFTFKCKAAQLPGKTLGVIEVPYFGRKIKVAGDQTFSEWTVTIINDESFGLANARSAFESWMSGINQHVANIRTNTQYMADAEVLQYSKTGDVLKSYKLTGVFPSDISPLDVSWESNDTIEEYTVTLQYQWWEEADTTDRS